MMKVFQGIATALGIAYIGVMSVAFFSIATTGSEESLRTSAVWLGVFSLVLAIMLAVPYIYKAVNVNGKDW
ncbi:membrane protein [Bacillus phage Darren]|nr:membrane protein [Bacillus phage Darren]